MLYETENILHVKNVIAFKTTSHRIKFLVMYLRRMMIYHILDEGTGFSGVIQPSGTSSTRVSTAPVQQSPRFGLPVAPRNEQLRTSMSEAMAVLAASGNAAIPGRCILRELRTNASFCHFFCTSMGYTNEKFVV